MESILRKDLKQWQRAFRATHGRDPTKRDILKDPAIASTYEAWAAVSAETRTASSSSTSSKRDKQRHVAPVQVQEQEQEQEQAQARPSDVFRTPTKPRPRENMGTRTPSSQTRTPVKPTPGPGPSPTGSVVDVQMTPTRQEETYEDVSSPSRLRTLVAMHAKRSPNLRKPSSLTQTYTPRTKARKRLRGEDVPPTPKPKSDAARRGSGAAFDAYLCGGERPGKKRATLSAYGFGPKRKAPPSDDEEEEEQGGSPSKSARARAFQPLFVSPSAKRMALAPPSQRRTSGGGGLFAAELEARRRQSMEGKKKEGRESDSDADSDRPTSRAMQKSSVPPTSSPVTGITTPSRERGTETTVPAVDGQPQQQQGQRRPSWKISTIVVSDNEGDESSADTVKTITVLPYQRYGSLRNKADREREEQDADDEEDLFGYALSRSPRKVEEEAGAGDGAGADSDSSMSDGEGLLLSNLSLHSPSRRLPAQGRQAIRAQRAHDATRLEALLGAGRDELEVLELEEETDGQKPAPAKNWGEAKARDKPSTKRRQPAPASALAPALAPRVKQREPQPVAARACARPLQRAGRSGMGDDEVCEDDEEQVDDDWASEVDSDEYGLGDGEMDRVDVI